MSCNHEQTTNCCQSSGNGTGFVIIIVLYILLAIMLGSWIGC